MSFSSDAKRELCRDRLERRDAAVANVRHNRIAYLGNTFPVEITVGARRLQGKSAQLTVVDGRGRNVASQRVDYADDDFSNTLSFNIKAETKATIRCIPFVPQDPSDLEPGVDMVTGKPSARRVLFARSY